ncbi:MAG TPA: carboxypeptidase-like regulatory domain-containing protein [Steroidobacteraceae bacterium]
MLVLLGRQWVPGSSEPVRAPARAVATHESARETHDVASAPVAAAPSELAPAALSAAIGVTFRGRVIDAVTRKPVRTFEVQLIRVHHDDHIYRQEDPLTRTFQSSTGRFAWTDMQAGTWIAWISARGYQRFDLDEFNVEAGTALPDLTMPLLHGFTLRGRVFDDTTGEGIADAYISFEPPDAAYHGDNFNQPYTRSKPDGTFEFRGLPGGDQTLSVSSKTHSARSVEVLVNDETPPLDVGLSQAGGGEISGRVVTSAGAPIQALLSLDGPGGGLYGTKDDGVFSYSHLPAGSYALTGATAAGRVKQEIELAPGERRSDMILTVMAGRTLRGTLRGLRPEQLKDVNVSARSQRQYFFAMVDEQGAYALNGLPPGQVTLEIRAGGRHVQKTVDVPADRDMVFDIVFPAGARLSGRVTRGGKPFANETVWMNSADPHADTGYRATTSAEGQYEIEGLLPGEYRLQAEEDIVRSITIAGDAVLNIEIPLVQLEGRVLEDEGAVPVVGADVYVRGVDAATAGVDGHRESDHFGQFKLTGVELGDIEIIVYKPGYDIYREKLAYSSPITNKTIRLRQGGGVEVRVLQSSKEEPQRGFYVSEKLGSNSRSIYYWIPLDRNGIGLIPGALAGSTFSINSDTEKPIVIRDWDGSPLELRF